ncbi:endothelin-converting enzyme homolog [Dermacentor andersoni]|uniref:endothelin-converting enzyme homolog n=1 Tax=Dermacentor andersoni TaxID=34620 RepID=UPI003B3B4C1F
MDDFAGERLSWNELTEPPRGRSLPRSAALDSPESASLARAVPGRSVTSVRGVLTAKRRYRISAPRERVERTTSTALLLEQQRLFGPSATSPSTWSAASRSPTPSELSKEWTPLLRPSKGPPPPLPKPGVTFALAASTTVASGRPYDKTSTMPPVGDSLSKKIVDDDIGAALVPSRKTHQAKRAQFPHAASMPSLLMPNEDAVRIDFEDQRKLRVDSYFSDESHRTRLPALPCNTPVGMTPIGRRPTLVEPVWQASASHLKLIAASTAFCALIVAISVVADSSFPHCEHPITCFNLTHELEASIDASVDPCSDMYDHVCGRWSEQYPGKRHQFALLNERLRFVLFRAVEESRDQKNAAEKAGLALASCMRVWSSGDVDNTGSISDVLNRRGLIWPATTNVAVRDVFRQLVAFTLKDDISVFFALKVFTHLKAGDKYTFELKYPQLIMEPILDPEELQTCIRTYNSSVDVTGLAMQIINLELDYATSTAVNSAYDYSPKYHKFGDIEAMYNSSIVSTDWWLDAINEHLPSDAAVGSDSVFLLYDKFALSSVTDILSVYSDRTMNLQNFIGWKIVRYLSYGASSKLSTCDFRDERGNWTFTFPVALKYCIRYVNEILPYGLLTLQLSGILAGSEIPYARNMTNDIRRAIEISYNFSWLDEQSAAGAVRRLRDIHAIIGGPSRLLSRGAVDAHYRHIPGVYKESFVNWLVDSYRAVAESKIKLVYPPSHPDYRSPSRDDWELTEDTVSAFYLPPYHLIYVPGSLLMPPFQSDSAPDSFNYGGLGKVIAHELTHAFDPKYIDVNYAREPDVFYTPQIKEKFLAKIDCLILQTNAMSQDLFVGERTITESFADNSGTELAYLTYAALAEARRKDGVAGFTADQSFFAATCFFLCGADGEKRVENSVYLSLKARCNQPLMNTEQFAEAFPCAVGAPMRPRNRCDIHTPRMMSRR